MMLFFKIETEWEGTPVKHDPVEVTLYKADEGGLNLHVSAPFFHDPPPDGAPGKPMPKLWEYEVVEVFILNENDQYLEVEVAPGGQHLVLMLKGSRNMFKDELPLSYTSKIMGDKWEGTAHIPKDYLPPNINKMNAYAIHGTAKDSQWDRIYEALYPAPHENHAEHPEFHNLSYFKEVDFGSLLGTEALQYMSHYWA